MLMVGGAYSAVARERAAPVYYSTGSWQKRWIRVLELCALLTQMQHYAERAELGTVLCRESMR
jgi:hypothetical protein